MASIALFQKKNYSFKVALVVMISLFLSGCGYNTIPTKEENAKAKWSQVLNNYKRRADLIPNLVRTVKLYAAHERETLTAIIEARAKATQTKIPSDILSNPDAIKNFQANQGALTSALSKLLVVVERYPNLKANQNFLALQSQLEGTENRIAVSRRDYIEAVRSYNTELKTFPGIIWNKTLHSSYKEMANFTVSEADTKAPVVK